MKKITNTAKKPMLEWLFGVNPSAIEQQEAEGQKQLAQSSQLPVKCNSHREIDIKSQYEKMGIKVIEPSEGDELFFDVQLPDGWEVRCTDHSMWTDLVDDKGRVRANIFYKAAFYDRDTFINFNNRITFSVDRLSFLENDYSIVDGDYKGDKTPYVGRVTDFDGKVLFETEQIKCDIEYVDYHGRKVYSEEYKRKSRKIEKELNTKCLNFLTEKYPDYTDINAYWDL